MLGSPVSDGRKIYLHVAHGALTANGQRLNAGDALMYSDEPRVMLEKADDAEVLLFDMG